MCRVRSEASLGLRSFVVGLAAAVAAVTFSSNSADARYHRGYVHYARHATIAPRAARAYHHAHAEGYSPPTSAIVVDGNTGAVLHASNADALRHPASLTKIMTLYLLFERLEAGKIRLDTPLKVSEHASEQAPTKLGLKPGQTIAVEDAIKAVVTKSANDAAVAIGENLGGDEASFREAHDGEGACAGHEPHHLRKRVRPAGRRPGDQRAGPGAARARDPGTVSALLQILLDGSVSFITASRCAITTTCSASVGGVDGIKTGYTHASGFNLVTSVHRDGRYIVAVVLGGRSSSERDAHMRELINEHIKEASLRHSAPAIAEKAEQRSEAQPVAFAKAPLSTAHPEPATTAALAPKAGGNATAGSSDQIQPL